MKKTTHVFAEGDNKIVFLIQWKDRIDETRIYDHWKGMERWSYGYANKHEMSSYMKNTCISVGIENDDLLNSIIL
jgi:hypothetical protein